VADPRCYSLSIRLSTPFEAGHAVPLRCGFEPHVAVYAASPEAFGPAEAACLSPEEVARADRFHRTSDRVLYQAAHGLLRCSLSRWGALPPLAWTFGTTSHGKPFVTNPGYTDLQFSLTHTAGLAACAVSSNGPVGIDAEARHRPIADLDRLVRSVLTRDEAMDVSEREDPDDRLTRFLCYWTLKEAYVKALGFGLSKPLRSFSISAGPSGTWRVVSDKTVVAPTEGWNLALVPSGPDHILALAVG